MNSKESYLVIGAGITGFAAAMSLKKAGKKVSILSKGPGMTSLSSGAWDFGPLSFEREGTPSLLHGSFEETCRSSIWSLLFRSIFCPWKELESEILFQKILKSIHQLQSSFQDEYSLSFSPSHPFFCPTASGSWKPVFLVDALIRQAALDKVKEGRTICIAHPSWNFPLQRVVEGWKFFAKKKRKISLDLNTQFLPDFDWAQNLTQTAVRLEQSSSFQSQWIEALKKIRDKTAADRFLFPPVFVSHELSQKMEKEIHCSIGECFSGIEPVAGFRLRKAMDLALKRVGVEQISFSTNWKAHTVPKRILSVQRTSKTFSSLEKEISFDQFLLCTGRFSSGGLSFYDGKLSETVFHYPILGWDGREKIRNREDLDWRNSSSGAKRKKENTWDTIGLHVDKNWRPIDENGEVVYENGFACGSILGGVDYLRFGMGMGILASLGGDCAQQIVVTP